MIHAYLLHRYDWSESSLILDLFTREQGRVTVAAKGAKRPYSQLRAVLLPFQRLHVQLAGRPRGSDGEAPEVMPLRGAERAGGPAMPAGAALLAGFYLNELLMKLLARHDPHPMLFDVYAQTLPALVDGEDLRVEAALRAFELLLLRETGLLPALDRITQTQRPLAPAGAYVLRAESGLAPVGASETGLDAAHWQALQAGLDADDLAALQRSCLPVLGGLKPMLRQLLHYHLGTPALRTRQLMMDLQNLER